MKRWQKIGIGIVIAIVFLIALGFWSRTKLQTLFYPVAPPMPAVVSETMPEILARLESILKTNAPHVLAALQTGLSTAVIANLEQKYHVQLPEDIKAIYEWHDGSARDTNFLRGDFIPIHRFLPLEEALEENVIVPRGPATLLQMVAYWLLAGHRNSWISLFADGAGDGYWFDPKRKPSEGSVFYNFTEEASFVFFPSPKNLMAGIAKCYEKGAFQIKTGSSPPELDEDFEQANIIWKEFGGNNLP